MTIPFVDPLANEYTLLIVTPLLTEEEVFVDFSEKYASKARTREDLMKIAEEEWKRQLELHPYLFNMSKFRYYDSAYNMENRECIIQLGLTEYKYYVATNLGSQWATFEREGVQSGNNASFFSNPLGNQCAVVLKDGKHVLLNRSFKVAESRGQLTCIGGHPEPSSIQIESYEDGRGSEKRIVWELFDSMKREVFEETNIPMKRIVEMRMIGIEACNKSHGRQVQLFCCFVNCTSEEVKEMYSKGPKDQYESQGIQFMTLPEIKSAITTNANAFCPESRGLYASLHQILDLFNEECIHVFT